MTDQPTGHVPVPDPDLPYHAGDRCRTCGVPVVPGAGIGSAASRITWEHVPQEDIPGGAR